MESKIKSLPKVELHVHLDGSLRVNTVLELANKFGVRLPVKDIRYLASYLEVKGRCNSLKEYLNKFELPLKVMRDKEALERIAYELVADASYENIKYLEIRYAPLLFKGIISKEETLQGISAGIKRATKEYGTRANIILCCMRNHHPKQSLEVAKLAIDYMDKGVVALDLAGDEARYPAFKHREAFVLAKEGGLHRTVHAGEAAGAKSVRDAIRYLHAERIGHGIRSREDLKLLSFLKEIRIPLEICPTSNIQTNIFNSICEHPAKEYYDLGIPITISTDNRRVSNISLTDEYLNLCNKLDFSLEDIKRIILMGVDASFLDKKEKDLMMKEFKEILLKN